MKTMLVPYGANVDNWATGYAFKNTSDLNHAVDISVTSEDGKVTKHTRILITPKAIEVLGPDDIKKLVDGRHSLTSVGPDEVFVIAINTLATKNNENEITSRSVFSLPIFDITETSVKN